jgi:hypothetical protein
MRLTWRVPCQTPSVISHRTSRTSRGRSERSAAAPAAVPPARCSDSPKTETLSAIKSRDAGERRNVGRQAARIDAAICRPRVAKLGRAICFRTEHRATIERVNFCSAPSTSLRISENIGSATTAGHGGSSPRRPRRPKTRAAQATRRLSAGLDVGADGRAAARRARGHRCDVIREDSARGAVAHGRGRVSAARSRFSLPATR